MNITKAFISSAKKYPEFDEDVNIVKKNSSGKIWLIGGFVYRTIAHSLYSSPKPQVDLDFIVEKPVLEFEVPTGWRIVKNRFNNPKFINGKKHIDYVPLKNVYSIIQRNIDATIENFLTGVPLTVQSIAYDVYENKIIGEIGIGAVKTRKIEVNDLDFAKYAAHKKGQSVREMIQEKADGLGFTPVFPVAK